MMWSEVDLGFTTQKGVHKWSFLHLNWMCVLYIIYFCACTCFLSVRCWVEWHMASYRKHFGAAGVELIMSSEILIRINCLMFLHYYLTITSLFRENDCWKKQINLVVCVSFSEESVNFFLVVIYFSKLVFLCFKAT